MDLDFVAWAETRPDTEYASREAVDNFDFLDNFEPIPSVEIFDFNEPPIQRNIMFPAYATSQFQNPSNAADGLDIDMIDNTETLPHPEDPICNWVKHLDRNILQGSPSEHPEEQIQLKPRKKQKPSRSTRGTNCKRRSKAHVARASFSPTEKAALEAQFALNPYPNKDVIENFAGLINVPAKQVTTWFRNARLRKKDSSTDPAAHGISTANIEALNRLSPAPSHVSLEKWLETPVDEDISPAVLRSAIQYVNSIREKSKSYYECGHDMTERDESATSAAGSPNHSGSSCNSSIGSYRSVDLRGSRRGRRTWSSGWDFLRGESMDLPPSSQKTQDMFTAEPLIINSISTNTSSRESTSIELPINLMQGGFSGLHTLPSAPASKSPLFCTWPECKKTFRYKSEWMRHEEAIHYGPYHWICCADTKRQYPSDIAQCFICGDPAGIADHYIMKHFLPCLTRDLKTRTFFRADHLAQHIKGTHLQDDSKDKVVPVSLLNAWKRENPHMPVGFLFCAFCDILLPTWAERQEHVYKHLSSGDNTGLEYKLRWKMGTFWNVVDKLKHPWDPLYDPET